MAGTIPCVRGNPKTYLTPTPVQADRTARHQQAIAESDWCTRGAAQLRKLQVWRAHLALLTLEEAGGRWTTGRDTFAEAADLSTDNLKAALKLLEKLGWIKRISGRKGRAYKTVVRPDIIVQMRSAADWRENYASEWWKQRRSKAERRRRQQRKEREKVLSQAVEQQIERQTKSWIADPYFKYGDDDVTEDEVDAWAW